MKIFLNLLLFLTISLSLQAYSNKTFLMPRSQNFNLAMQNTTFNEVINKNYKYKNGLTFDINTFYQESFQAESLGRYFGVKSKNVFSIGNQNYSDISLDNIMKSSFGRVGAQAFFELKPKQKVYGVSVDLYQNLDEFHKNLYLKVNVPFVNVNNSLNNNFIDITLPEVGYDHSLFLKNDLESLFAGNYVNKSQNQAQERLKHAKIVKSCSKFGVADLDCILGYKFVNKPETHFALNLGATLPTGNRVEGVYLFEPICGNGNHFGLGAGFDFGTKLLGKNSWALKLNLIANYRYLFSATEKRTLSLKLSDWKLIPGAPDYINDNFSHYFLLGKQGYCPGKPLFHAADLLTTNIKVTPQSEIDFLASFSYINGGLNFDIGYNPFYKNQERVSVKKNPVETDIFKIGYPVPDMYGIAIQGFDTQVAFDIQHFAVGQRPIVLSDLDLNSVKTPGYITHKIFMGLGYIFGNWEKPLFLGMGSFYEISNNNGQLENWSIWSKIGFSF